MIMINSICIIYFHCENEHSILNASPKYELLEKCFLCFSLNQNHLVALLKSKLLGMPLEFDSLGPEQGQKFAFLTSLQDPILKTTALDGHCS